MNHFVTPWAVVVFVLSLLLVFVPWGVVAYEDRHKREIYGSRMFTWLFFHEAEIMIVTVATIFAAWRLEHGFSVRATAACFIMPAAVVAGKLLRRLPPVIRGRSEGQTKARS